MTLYVRVLVFAGLVLCPPCLAAAAPITPTAFEHLQEGMSQEDVRRQVGAPDAVQPVAARPGRGARVHWFYTGTAHTLPVRLTFEQGKLVQKWQGR
jgi:hypothetical protein